MMNTFARDEVDAFLAELPPRVVDFVELPLEDRPHYDVTDVMLSWPTTTTRSRRCC